MEVIEQANYDAVVLGAGPSGMMAALAASREGARVLVCERRSLKKLRENARYQAVVIDRQTIGSLRLLGVDERFIQKLTHCEFFGPKGSVTGTVPFAGFHASEPKAGSSLKKILFRREVVALASIRELEDKLRETCLRDTKIHLEYRANTVSISESNARVDLAVDLEGKTKHINAKLVAIADGANSDKHGGLALLQQRKKTLLRTGSIVTCRLAPQIDRGVIRILGRPGKTPAIGAAFALPHETVAYGTTSLKDASRLTPLQINEMLISLGLNGNLTEPPNFIPQVVRIARKFVIGKRCLVLGDAAFSGSAAMGSYLNKGLADGMAFGKICRHLGYRKKLSRKIRKYAGRRYSPAIETLIAEERTGKLIVAGAELPNAKVWDNTFGHLLTRHIFRLKIRRKSIPHTLCATALDNVASIYHYYGDVANVIGFRLAGKIYQKLGKYTEKYLRYLT